MDMDNKIKIEALLSGKVKIETPDMKVYHEVKRRWDNAAKPLDSLGRFEDITARIGAVTGNADIDIDKKAVIVMCADNGIVEEGVSQSGQEVTLAVSRAMGRRESSVCKMASKAGMSVIPVDIGINSDERIDGVVHKKVCKGTRNFSVEPAMTRGEFLRALQAGMDIACEAVNRGIKLICLGEMGIGNTTTSAAVVCALTGLSAKEAAGRGAGLDDGRLRKKVSVIEKAIEKYDLHNADAACVLETVGGFDIAGMVGVMVGAALCRTPVVLDGVVSCAAALAAVRMFPEIKNYLIASHMSSERTAKYVFDELKLTPVINAEMALGEGTGAVMMCALLDIALTLYKDQLTFDDIEIEKYTRFV
jgi:nicotinate-nucleotide--dimethylbenzimidazole phosphoribosyltransferase